MTEMPHIGKGRAGLRRKHEPDCINQPSDVPRRISERSKIVTGKTNNPQPTNGACDRGINVTHWGNSGFLRFSGELVSFRKLGQLDLYILL